MPVVPVALDGSLAAGQSPVQEISGLTPGAWVAEALAMGILVVRGMVNVLRTR